MDGFENPGNFFSIKFPDPLSKNLIFIYKHYMKIIITSTQLLKLLDTMPPKFPLTVKVKGLTKIEREELFNKINAKKKKD